MRRGERPASIRPGGSGATAEALSRDQSSWCGRRGGGSAPEDVLPILIDGREHTALDVERRGPASWHVGRLHAGVNLEDLAVKPDANPTVRSHRVGDDDGASVLLGQD